MIGFIMLPAVSKDGNEFGILGCKRKKKDLLFQNISLLDLLACCGMSLHCLMSGYEYIFFPDPEIRMSSVLIVSLC